MKKRKALDLQDLHETAAACHWANGFLTDPKGRIEAEKSHGEMESYMDRLKFHFGVWKSNKRPDLAIQTILIYAYEERHTYYFKYSPTRATTTAPPPPTTMPTIPTTTPSTGQQAPPSNYRPIGFFSDNVQTVIIKPEPPAPADNKNPHLKECEHCQKQYQYNAKKQKFCSNECRWAADKARKTAKC